MARRILSIVTGLAVAFAIIILFETVSGSLFKTPGLDPREPKTISDMMASMPVAAFVWLLLGYAVSAFAGGAVATFISGRKEMRPALVAGAALTAGGIMNLIAIPYHPVWFVVANVFIYLPFACLGYMMARKKSETGLKPVDDIS